MLVLNSSCAKDVSVGFLARGRSVCVLMHLPGTTGLAKRLCNSNAAGSQSPAVPAPSPLLPETKAARGSDVTNVTVGHRAPQLPAKSQARADVLRRGGAIS